jgi:hypothetical protein
MIVQKQTIENNGLSNLTPIVHPLFLIMALDWGWGALQERNGTEQRDGGGGGEANWRCLEVKKISSLPQHTRLRHIYAPLLTYIYILSPLLA